MVSGGADESKDLNLTNESDGSTLSNESNFSNISLEDDRTLSFHNTNPLPYGNYKLIGIDIDTTGRRLIDEIVQISAYTPNSQYSQYIMPLMNLNPAARQRHQVRVITVGFFRMLKSMQTYKVVKTKTEVIVLNEFIDWLEKENQKNGENSDGVVLIYHEQRKFVPYMMIEALKKYNLLDRFTKTVKSFANGYKLAEEKCSKEVTIKYFSIRQLAKLVMDENDSDKNSFEGHAYVRARLAYEIFQSLATNLKDDSQQNGVDNQQNGTTTAATTTMTTNEISTTIESVTAAIDDLALNSPSTSGTNENNQATITVTEAPNDTSADATKTDNETTKHVTHKNELTDEEMYEKMINILCDLASPITKEITELNEQEQILLRQNSLRSVFIQYFKTTLYHRVKAVTYRRVLAECGYDFDSLKQIWTNNKEELQQALDKLEELKEEERKELFEILDCHFDPEKQSLKPVVKRTKRRPSRGAGRPFFANNRNVNHNSNNTNNDIIQNNNNQNKDNRGMKPQRRNSRNFTNKTNNQQQQQQQQQTSNNNGMMFTRSPPNNKKRFNNGGGGGGRYPYANNNNNNRRRNGPGGQRRQNYYNNNNRNNIVAINA
uniref:Putative exuperantia n=1 Tax=Corethrella appendiculata TaxID=1370023 RepID=U5EVD9_9DIPT